MTALPQTSTNSIWRSNHLEMELLLCCARTHLDSGQSEHLQTLITQDLNWSLVLRLAEIHGVLPLLTWHLQKLQRSLYLDENKTVQDFLEHFFRLNLSRNLLLTSELLKLVNKFESEQISVLSFKGPILAQIAYNHLGLRQFLDLDLLVKERQVIPAIHLLIGQGYQPQFDLSEYQYMTYARIRNELMFWHEEKQIAVDLHWDLLPKGYSYCPHPAIPWQGCEKVTFARKDSLTLSREHLLLYLCAHGSKHNWSRLMRLCDVAELIKNTPELNWNQVQSQAGQFGSKRMLYLGLYLAHTLLSTPLPGHIIEILKQHPQPRRCVESLQYQWIHAHDPSAQKLRKEKLCFWETLEQSRDRAWYIFDTVFTPTPFEWKIISLPHWLYLLYYPIRMGRLVIKWSLILLSRNSTHSA